MSHAATSFQMHAYSNEDQPRLYDGGVIFIVGVLMVLGVAMVYSASVTVQGAAFDWRQWWNTPLRQGVFVAGGFLAMLFAAHCDYRWLAWSRPGAGWRAGILWAVALALLVAMLIPGVGREALGARRALVVFAGPPTLSFQPTEIAKIVLVVWVAAFLARPTVPMPRRRGFPVLRDPPTPPKTVGRRFLAILLNRPTAQAGTEPLIRSFRDGFVPVVLTSGLLIGLTAIEDFGTAALMGMILLVLLLVSGAKWSHLALLGVGAACMGAALVIMEPYRIERIRTFFADSPDPQGAGYQINQALMAIASGGWFGRGLGAGVQKYGYLPQDNNDFIFAIICEELGIVGGLVVVGLFLLLLWRGWRIAAGAPDRFGQLLAVGLTLTICFQAAFNVGVVTNSVPTKGISLPFVSAGGSGVVFLGLAAGLLASIGRHGTCERPPGVGGGGASAPRA